jgi:hypothetical protein
MRPDVSQDRTAYAGVRREGFGDVLGRERPHAPAKCSRMPEGYTKPGKGLGLGPSGFDYFLFAWECREEHPGPFVLGTTVAIRPPPVSVPP